MASLLKLVDTKSNKPGINLMHYVVMASGFNYFAVTVVLSVFFCILRYVCEM